MTAWVKGGARVRAGLFGLIAFPLANVVFGSGDVLKEVPGTWELVSLEGRIPGSVVAERTDVAEYGVTGLDVRPGEWIREVRITEITLDIHPEGDFREERIVITTNVISPEFLQRFERFAWWPDDEPMTVEGQPDTTVVFGEWTTEEGSVFLRQDRRALTGGLYELARGMAEMQGATAEELAEADEELRAWAEAECEERFGEPPTRYKGTVEGNRFVGYDLNGLQVRFRKASSDGKRP